MTINPMDVRQKIGRTICELRKSRGVTQTQICEYSGLSQKYVSDIENGKRNLGIDTVVMLANFFDMSLGDFFLLVEQAEE